MTPTHPRVAAGVGIGLRQPHWARVAAAPPPLAFVEVHAENHFADGGAAVAALDHLRERLPVSLHGVGLALGSAAGIDAWHLDRLERLVRRVDPVRVSDHACFARAPLAPGAAPVHGADLLPIAFTPAQLAILGANVQRVQDRLGRAIAVENISAYLRFADAQAMPEAEFFGRLVHATGCRVLLDVNNLWVNAVNAHTPDAAAACRDFVDALPAASVDEIHVAGYRDAGALAIDDHGSRVREPVWALHAHARRRFPDALTLVEWDTQLPALEVLLAEADRAASAPVTVADRVPA